MATKSQLIRQRERRNRRRHRIKKKVSGTPEKPRMVVYRGLYNIEVQLVDDLAGHSLIGLSTRSKELHITKFESRVDQGREVGKIVAEKAREKGIEKVVFDRGGVLYHGIIKAVADGAREGGLQF